jgi:hypothetical protein
VINGADRQQFERLLGYESAQYGLNAIVAGKAASKRRRGL